MAHKKGQGSTKNGRSSNPQYRGIKVYGGERVKAGSIIVRQLGSRFRAVILTSLTTIAGLSPLMFESSSLSMYVTPIAVTLCFGLALATGLVLLVIPALILLLETLKAHAAHQLSRVMPRFANATVRTGTDE